MQKGFDKAGTKLKVVVRGKSNDAEVTKMPFVPTHYFKVGAMLDFLVVAMYGGLHILVLCCYAARCCSWVASLPGPGARCQCLRRELCAFWLRMLFGTPDSDAESCPHILLCPQG